MGELEFGKVFSSKITRNNNLGSSELYDLLRITAAVPINIEKNQFDPVLCSFRPNIHKYYMHKKRSKLKVKTVRDIRNTFEKDVYAHLPMELEKQQNMLLKKIKDGASANEQFKNISKTILNADNPISRTALQMLININPNNYKYPKQYVLWNGKYIHVNGSQGGRTKFLCNYDLGKISIAQKKRLNLKNKTKKIGLLKNSLFVKFKPGPLRTKKHLDDSHQKHHVGEIELIQIPKPCLDVYPTYGVSLDITATRFLNNLRDMNGHISQTWAEFAASVVGNVNKSKAVQSDSHSKITFDLNYKYDQNRILMRRDEDKLYTTNNNNTKKSKSEVCLPNQDAILLEVKEVISKMLDSVEISLLQDTLDNGSDDSKENICRDSVPNTNLTDKEKTKRKYKELNRLDVTVIQLPDKCQNSFCDLGCVCESLAYSHTFKRHCGLLKCMFDCKCGFANYSDVELIENEDIQILPNDFDEDRQSKLAREEQKFHQTVIVSGEKRILLKADKSDYKNFRICDNKSISNSDNQLISKELTVVTRKLNLKNVLPWCMVHNLYKCFCKNRFIEKCNYEADILNVNMTINESSNIPKIDNNCDQYNDNTHVVTKIVTRQEKRKSIENLLVPVITDEEGCVCARTTNFQGRKYNEDYYKATNKRILEMEQNDVKLQKKLEGKVDKIGGSPRKRKLTVDDVSLQTSEDNWDVKSEMLNLLKLKGDSNDSSIAVTNDLTPKKSMSSSRLVMWIESNYKFYKRQTEVGIKEKALVTPKKGKLAFHSWEFILKRYKNKLNFFLVSKDKPFHIYMAVDYSSPFFNNCINIDDIRFADLNYYPDTVKRLVTDAKDLKDSFCILRGHPNCWELVGTVSKRPEEVLTDSSETTEDYNFNDIVQNDTTTLAEPSNSSDTNTFTAIDSNTGDTISNKTSDEISGCSRWFVMRIENDFSEIQFHNKGFFVKYESILKAIDVARQSDKTVRISSQKCTEKSVGPQFGIYAIPNSNEHSVFVGPYEPDEPLGIKTIKTFWDLRKQKTTRGVWITTNKIDNLNVINNPMSFMPLFDKSYKEMSSVCDIDVESSEAHDNAFTKDNSNSEIYNKCHGNETSTNSTSTKKAIKIVKPIKIRKIDTVYQIAPNNILKRSVEKDNTLNKLKSNKVRLVNVQHVYSGVKKSQNKIDMSPGPSLRPIKVVNSKLPITKPVAQIAPLVNNDLQQSLREREITSTGMKKGLIVLKPEEVVKILTEKQKGVKSSDNESFKADLNSSDDVLLISDDDDENVEIDISEEPPMRHGQCQHVKINCSTVSWNAWLPGRKDEQNLLSFTFPGCEPSKYYKEEEALSEINRIFLSKVEVPADVGLMWQVTDTDDVLENATALTSDVLNSDYVLTSTGLQHKNTLPVPCEELEHDKPSGSIQDEVPVQSEIIVEICPESSLQNAIVLEDGSLFMMDDKNKNAIHENLVTSTDDEKLQFLNALQGLKTYST